MAAPCFDHLKMLPLAKVSSQMYLHKYLHPNEYTHLENLGFDHKELYERDSVVEGSVDVLEGLAVLH